MQSFNNFKFIIDGLSRVELEQVPTIWSIQYQPWCNYMLYVGHCVQQLENTQEYFRHFEIFVLF